MRSSPSKISGPCVRLFNYRGKYEGPAAAFYDQDHRWRDYAAQSRFVASLFSRRAAAPVRILDLCCGTGTHSVALARRGFEVTGVDRSRDLLDQAQQKSAKLELSPRFVQADIYSLRKKKEFGGSFDACLLLGWTLTIQPVYRRFSDILQAARAALRPGGLFIFDVPLDSHANRGNPPVLRYRSSSKLSGSLSIKEQMNSSRSESVFYYSWKVKDGDRTRNFTVKEVLSRVKFSDIEAAVSQSGFAEVMFLSGYDVRKKYRPGSVNLVGILKKEEL